MIAPILELRHVSKSYPVGGRWHLMTQSRADNLAAVHDVSLAIQPAEVVALVGQSGAGKSTLARLILGLEQPDAGELFFDGTEMGRLSRGAWRHARQQMHLIFQDPYQSLHPGMRVAQLVAEPLVIGRTPRREHADAVSDALAAAGLDPPAEFLARFPHQLSGGQRQRVALARALVMRPKLIIADEPTSMLDASLQSTILTLIEKFRVEFGIAFLFITHDLRLAQQVSDRIAVMRAGQLVEVGDTETVMGQPQHEYTRLLLRAGIQGRGAPSVGSHAGREEPETQNRGEFR